MIRKAVALLGSAMMLALAAPATAQLSGSASGTTSAPRQGTVDDYWYLMRQMGDCIAHRKTEQATAFLAAEPGSAEETRIFKGLFNRAYNGCMQRFVSVTFVRAHLRGSIAEALYRENVEDRDPAWRPQVAEPETVVSLHDFAQCYISTHYAKAQNLLDETRLATDEELRVMRTMAADFGPCLPQGREVTLKPIDIRLAIAEAMYRATMPVSGMES